MAGDFDAIVVCAHINDCAIASVLARQGWHVALVECKVPPLGGTLSLSITRSLSRAEVSYYDASTARTIHTGEPFFRTFHHLVERSFQFPLETPSPGRQFLRTAEKMSEL